MVRKVRLSQWARENSVHYFTALKWFHAGVIKGVQLPTGTIFIHEEEDTTTQGKCALYARVSGNTPRDKESLTNQLARLEAYANLNNLTISKRVKEHGSGTNDQRPKLAKLLNNDDWDTLIIEHKDRLTRSGYHHIELLLAKQGKKIHVINPPVGDEDDLINDFISIITSYCHRLYGKRRGKRKAIALKKVIESEED